MGAVAHRPDARHNGTAARRALGVELNGSTDRALPAGVGGVAVIVVTWNRREDVMRVVGALSRQTFGAAEMDVVIVDNASRDGTLEAVGGAWRPEWVVLNETDRAEAPSFVARHWSGEGGAREVGERNLGGFRSLTIVRNSENLGGCGGFNTGFGYIAHALGEPGGEGGPEFVWLVDDDIDLPAETLERLVSAARADGAIGLVGSRTMDIGDRENTIESTIYFNWQDGAMADHPHPRHRLSSSHDRWSAAVGGPKGRNEYSGVREVDVVSACSLLARWKAVGDVGFWDKRYFIYCDDADWCLRFGRAGYRVTLNLDAVVYHTPWFSKLTPARVYYAQRNSVWMLQKALVGWKLSWTTLRRVWAISRDALRASLHHRLFHAEIIRRTVEDVIAGRGGKFPHGGLMPDAEPLETALRRTGALAAGARVAILCQHAGQVAAARTVMDAAKAAAGAGMGGPVFRVFIRDGLQGAADEAGIGGPERVVYGHTIKSRAFRQLREVKRPIASVVVIDQTTDMPLLRGAWNIHVDSKDPTGAQVERDGWARRFAFFARWLATLVRGVFYAAGARPYRAATRYG